MGDHEQTTPEREGIVDQQAAALERSGSGSAGPATGRRGESTAEREGIVDQQDAALEKMEDVELDEEIEHELEQVQDTQETG